MDVMNQVLQIIIKFCTIGGGMIVVAAQLFSSVVG